MPLSFQDMKSWWNSAGAINAASAILSGDEAWDQSSFYATGVSWADEHASFAEKAVGYSGGHARLSGLKALDFGCGLGRMTRAWSTRYDEVVGIDISEEMVMQARAANPNGKIDFLVVDQYPFPFEPETFDFVYSTIVVQHIPLPHSLAYVSEFFRVLKPGGFCLFDAPSQECSQKLKPSDGLFLLPFPLVVSCGQQANCILIGLRTIAVPLMHYQYLFQKLPVDHKPV